MKLPPLRAVQYFEVIARLLSFSRAALELNVSQSAVSHQIRLLEDFLGERLLLRHAELQRTNALLAQQVAALTQERDSLQSRLQAARARVNALLDRLPAEPELPGTAETKDAP